MVGLRSVLEVQAAVWVVLEKKVSMLTSKWSYVAVAAAAVSSPSWLVSEEGHRMAQ